MLERRILTRIRAEGRITFADFMEIALYDPESGYYASTDRIGESGDFFTSPSIHPAFGALICIQLHEMWRRLESPAEFAVIEPGAGSGLLSSDIQAYASRIGGGFEESLQYRAVDRAARRSLPAGPDGPTRPAQHGCVLSNELLDAFPAHRVTVVDGELKELWVVERDGVLVEEPGRLSDPAIAERLEPLLPRLPDGYVGEVNLDLEEWAQWVSGALATGYVLTIDYGYPRESLYALERRRGTLRCYYRHTINANPFQHIGQQDLSIHVDFSALDEALGKAGFASVGAVPQADFLERLGVGRFLRELEGRNLSRRDAAANRRAVRELLDPNGLGGFRVAIHARVGSDPPLTGLSGNPDGADITALPLPLLDNDPRRVRLLEGGYPQPMEFSATWDELLGGPPDEGGRR